MRKYKSTKSTKVQKYKNTKVQKCKKGKEMKIRKRTDIVLLYIYIVYIQAIIQSKLGVREFASLDKMLKHKKHKRYKSTKNGARGI